MNTNDICLVRSRKNIQKCMETFPKPKKTIILAQNLRRKGKKDSYHTRIYMVKDLQTLLEYYPITTNNYLHEMIPSDRVVKPYIVFEFLSWVNVKSYISQIHTFLQDINDYLSDNCAMDCDMPWDLQIFEEKDKKSVICILNNGYYYRNNNIQKNVMVKAFSFYREKHDSLISCIKQDVYEHLYTLLMCYQTKTDCQEEVAQSQIKEVDDYRKLFVVRYHRYYQTEYYLDEIQTQPPVKIRKIKRKHIKKKMVVNHNITKYHSIVNRNIENVDINQLAGSLENMNINENINENIDMNIE